MISLELNADPNAAAPATALLDRNDGAEPDAGEDTSARHARVGRIMTALTQLGLMQFAVAAGGVVRNKVMAVYLKPDGFGEFTQVFGIAAAVYGFVQFGMAVGLSRNVAATQERKDRQRQLDSANLLTVGLALGCLALLAPLLLTNASIIHGSNAFDILISASYRNPYNLLRYTREVVQVINHVAGTHTMLVAQNYGFPNFAKPK